MGKPVKLKIDKITWRLSNRKEPQVCAVMAWDDYRAIEQQGFDQGWEARRKYDEKRKVEQFRRRLR